MIDHLIYGAFAFVWVMGFVATYVLVEDADKDDDLLFVVWIVGFFIWPALIFVGIVVGLYQRWFK